MAEDSSLAIWWLRSAAGIRAATSENNVIDETSFAASMGEPISVSIATPFFS